MNPESDPNNDPLGGSNMFLPIKNGIRFGKWIDEIALKEVFRFSNNTIINYRRQGILPHTRFGGRFFFDVIGILQVFEQNKR